MQQLTDSNKDDGVTPLKRLLAPLRTGLFEEVVRSLELIRCLPQVTLTRDLDHVMASLERTPPGLWKLEALIGGRLVRRGSKDIERLLFLYEVTLKKNRQLFPGAPPPAYVWCDPARLTIRKGHLVENTSDGLRIIHPGCLPAMTVIERL